MVPHVEQGLAHFLVFSVSGVGGRIRKKGGGWQSVIGLFLFVFEVVDYGQLFALFLYELVRSATAAEMRRIYLRYSKVQYSNILILDVR